MSETITYAQVTPRGEVTVKGSRIGWVSQEYLGREGQWTHLSLSGIRGFACSTKSQAVMGLVKMMEG